MVTITVKIDKSCKMASVFDSNGEGMEGNYWDFHNGCHGLYHLENFNSVEGFIKVLKDFNENKGEEVHIFRENYDYDNEMRIASIENAFENTLSKILKLSNLEYCESSDDMQNALEKIKDLITELHPQIEEEKEEEDD